MAEELSLKWGTIKSYRLDVNGVAFALMNQYRIAGKVSASAMSQVDNQKQKEIICQIIDALDAETVHLSWTGKDVSKEEAKKYVMEYD